MLNASEFGDDVGVVSGEVAEAAENLEGFCTFGFGEEKAGGLGGEEDADTPDYCRGELQTRRELPLEARASVVFCDAIVEEETEDDTELLTTGVLEGKQATNASGCDLKVWN